ncbi:hypothetical protein [Desulfoplanes formicivorans]|uniref:Uncharacterized protein n=1 Tax=Desulfoplanes formicivorans TaxID=1592317 RepID=A0A194AM65_9BACT|nr:hypothetical protein [Desulfoplanes formicivorans]GAU09739.1 hypothetical protein DPF_2471 [Desulfoplanes formicivorans]
MQKIPLPLAEPDMVLEKPVTRENGMILVGQGTVLTESLIARLKNMGIASVVVQGHPLDLDTGGGGTSMGRRGERLEHLFRHVDQDPFMHGIRLFLNDYFTRKGALEGMAPQADDGREG